MILYIDTEFTDLIPGNKLISIALVDENEEYFYAELTDTYELSDCSDFVKEHVLPYLLGGEYKMTFYECALKIGHWIEARNVDCILGMDNPSWDKPHLVSLLGDLWPENLHKNYYHPVHVSDSKIDNLVKKHNYTIHNALHDALIMAKADKQ